MAISLRLCLEKLRFLNGTPDPLGFKRDLSVTVYLGSVFSWPKSVKWNKNTWTADLLVVLNLAIQTNLENSIFLWQKLKYLPWQFDVKNASGTLWNVSSEIILIPFSSATIQIAAIECISVFSVQLVPVTPASCWIYHTLQSLIISLWLWIDLKGCQQLHSVGARNAKQWRYVIEKLYGYSTNIRSLLNQCSSIDSTHLWYNWWRHIQWDLISTGQNGLACFVAKWLLKNGHHKLKLSWK